MEDPRLLRSAFRDLGTWRAWAVFLRAVFGLGIEDPEDLALFRECTGLQEPPSEPVREGWAIVGRRGGKSFIAALDGAYIAGSRNWLKVLGRGERVMVFIIAVDRAQAKIIKTYCEDILKSSPAYRQLVSEVTQEEIRLNNGASIVVKTSSFRGVRGYSCACVILEECAFFRSEESANPDIELLRAVRPALETVPGSLLLAISTPYAKRGALWEAFKDHYGKPGGPLVWRAPSTRMNPTLSLESVSARLAEDPAGAASEWLAEFRSDISSFIPSELIEGLIMPGRRELPRLEGIRYYAFADPSGGSVDSFALAIAHRSPEGRVILDAVRVRRPPFSAEDVVAEFAECLRSFGLSQVRGDRYAGSWPRERFRVHGIDYQVSEETSSELFLEVLPVLTSGGAELLDDKRVRVELGNLERRVRVGGRDAIGHGPGAHDDLAVCIAGAFLQTVKSGASRGRVYFGGERVSGPPAEPSGPSRQQVFFRKGPERRRSPEELDAMIRESLARGRRPPEDDD
jgi:hypothetical protein